MLFTKLEIDNLYGFTNTCIDFTYRRKLINPSILDEFLPGREKFKVKRVCIFSGANASGKTSLGRLMCYFQNVLDGGHRATSAIENLKSAVADKTRDAALCIEFVTESDYKLHKFRLRFLKSDGAEEPRMIAVRCASVAISTSDSNTIARQKLEAVFDAEDENDELLDLDSNINMVTLASKLPKMRGQEDFGWHYLFAETLEHGIKSHYKNRHLDLKVLNAVLKTFDTSIDSVAESFSIDTSTEEKKPNGFEIVFNNRNSVLINLEGEGSPKDVARLSRGTYEAISLAGFISTMKSSEGENTIFFMDEKMAHVHTELEQAIVATMINLLGKGSQLFYTTHNSDILAMNLPTHSFVFFKKKNGCTQAIHAEEHFKKNDRTLRNAIKNDLFGTVPDSSAILNLLDD